MRQLLAIVLALVLLLGGQAPVAVGVCATPAAACGGGSAARGCCCGPEGPCCCALNAPPREPTSEHERVDRSASSERPPVQCPVPPASGAPAAPALARHGAHGAGLTLPDDPLRLHARKGVFRE